MLVTTWHFEMRAGKSSERPRPDGVRVERVPRPPLHFYRYLYETVGREWLWVDRRRFDDDALAAIVHDPRVELYVAYEDGAPAGFYELDRRVRKEIELAYFGLMPERIGRGLGAWLLEDAVARAWSYAPARVWVHTCSLDHPRARAVYEAAGFTVFRVEEREQTDPRPLPVPPR